MMVLALVFMVSLCSAEVVFEEDFESAEDYQSRWQAPTGWALVKSEIRGRKTTVLDVKGGGEGLSVQGGLGDFDYEADFRVVNKWGGFIFRARDVSNLYMLQFAADDDLFYPHTRKNGGYSLVRLPFAGRIPLGQWRHIKFEIRGNKFKCFLGENPDRMELAGQWEGKEPYQGGRFGFRCHGDEHIQVDNIQISTSEQIAPELQLDRSGLPRMIVASQSFEVKVNVQNTGWKTVKNLRATLSLPRGLKLVKGGQAQSCRSLKTGAGHEFSWKVKAEEVTAGRMEIAVACNELPAAKTILLDCVVNRALPAVSGKPAEEAAAGVDLNENVILENQNLRIGFVKNPKGYAAAVIYVYDGNKWRQVAVSQPIGHIAYRTAAGQDVESDILPTSCEILDAGGPLAEVRFAAEKVDEDGCWWNFVYTFQVESGKDTVRTHYQAWADKDRQLLYFQGPDLYAGEGSFGSAKSQALLPGVEYLEPHERSSSDRDMVPAQTHPLANLFGRKRSSLSRPGVRPCTCSRIRVCTRERPGASSGRTARSFIAASNCPVSLSIEVPLCRSRIDRMIAIVVFRTLDLDIVPADYIVPDDRRCMGDGVMRDEYPEAGQRRAVCQSQWDNKDKKGQANMDEPITKTYAPVRHSALPVLLEYVTSRDWAMDLGILRQMAEIVDRYPGGEF